jgi:hypothetical protein
MSYTAHGGYLPLISDIYLTECIDIGRLAVYDDYIGIEVIGQIGHGIGEKYENARLLPYQKDTDDHTQERTDTLGLVVYDKSPGSS